MTLSKLAYWARRIHRISMWAVLVSGLIQMFTGLAQEYTLFSFIPLGTAISVHTLNSTLFVIFLLTSMITGLTMYLVPVILKRRNKTSDQL